MSSVLANEVSATWLTPKLGRVSPIHRWFVFPHSYAPQLVEWLISKLDLRPGCTVLDPFCGAGTTLVEAQRAGLRSIGIDLLPLAVLVSRAKTRHPNPIELRAAHERAVDASRNANRATPPDVVLSRALGSTSYGHLRAALDAAGDTLAGDCVRLAVLSITRRFSTLVADGGWLRERKPERPASQIPQELDRALAQMERDLGTTSLPLALVEEGDARRLNLADGSVDAVVTSPPYPNRHDYTRVFAVELALTFGLGDGVRTLRRQAIHSHPEARPTRPDRGYVCAPRLDREIARVKARHKDARIARMLDGYFRDLHDVLVELRRVLRPGGRVALVVGNAQYCGISIPVDEHLAVIAVAVGFVVEDVSTVRIRGNSAQQMKGFGRRPSRESIVELRRP